MSSSEFVGEVDTVALCMSKMKQKIAGLEKALALAKGDYPDYPDHLVMHQFMLTAAITTPSDGITIRATTTIHNDDANFFFKKKNFKISGTAGVSHQHSFFSAGENKWTNLEHLNRFTFRLSHAMCLIPHIKIEVTMYTKKIDGHRTLIVPLMFRDDGSTAEIIDDGDEGITFVNYFTTTNDHIIQNHGNHEFDFGVIISIWGSSGEKLCDA